MIVKKYFCGIIITIGKIRGETVSDIYVPADNNANVVKHPVRGGNDTGADMFISFDYSKTFAPIDNPIPCSFDPYEKCGYSTSLFFSEDGTTLYYANNPPCYESTYKITVAKIRIPE